MIGLVESSFETKTEILESTNSKQKNYFIEGVICSVNKRNGNGRVYPSEIWDKNIVEYKKEIEKKSNRTLSEWGHPVDRDLSIIDPLNAVATCVDIKRLDNQDVWAKFKILNDNTPQTNKIKALIEEGIPIGVSTRGTGDLNSNNVVTKYKLINIDFVDNPSNQASNLKGLTESKYRYILNENNEIQSIINNDDTLIENIDKGDFDVLYIFKEILNEYGAKRFCDLSDDRKEDVLIDFINVFIEDEDDYEDYENYL